MKNKDTMKKLTDRDPETKSPDLVADNLERLKALFPELVTEGQDGASVNVDVLKQLIGDHTVTDAEEKYGLNWHGKRRARQLTLTPSTGTLRPFPADSVDWDTTQNIMIEGDNLEVLKLLQKSYAGKVKLIYIDPPYNTGSDLVYSDDFRDNIANYQMLTGQRTSDGRRLSTNTEASGRFHTEWLSMIFPRLRLARNLLASSGVILISIDDHELHDLRSVCDEVFGAENFVATLVWEKGRKNDARLISVGHEYLLLYARSLSQLREQRTVWREEKPGARELWDEYVRLRDRIGEDNTAIESALTAWFNGLPKNHPARKWTRYKRVDKHGPWRDFDISWPGGGGPRYDVLHPATKKPCKVPERGWIFSTPEVMQRQIKLGLVEFRADHTEPPFRKAHIRPLDFELLEQPFDANQDEPSETSRDDDEELATQVRGSYFYKQSQVSVKYLRKLLGAKVFDNPKDHIELARLVDYLTAGDKEALVVDFFAGSGSTGEAVWERNNQDSGSRRFILVQLPEQLDPAVKEQKAAADYCDTLGRPRNIAELTKERLRRASSKIKNENPMFAADLGFRVFKLDSSNIQAWDPNRADLAASLEAHAKNLKLDRSEQDILFELLLKLGLDLTVPITTKKMGGTKKKHDVYSIGGGVLLVCLSDAIARDDIEPVAMGIIRWHGEQAPAGESTVVFRDSAFAEDVAKTNLAAILNQHGLPTVRSL